MRRESAADGSGWKVRVGQSDVGCVGVVCQALGGGGGGGGGWRARLFLYRHSTPFLSPHPPAALLPLSPGSRAGWRPAGFPTLQEQGHSAAKGQWCKVEGLITLSIRLTLPPPSSTPKHTHTHRLTNTHRHTQGPLQCIIFFLSLFHSFPFFKFIYLSIHRCL